MSLDLDRDTYETEIIQHKGVALVDFWGPQCKPCLALMPAVGRLEEKYSGKIKVAKVNAWENRMLCARLKVMTLPAYIFYKDGVETTRLGGDQLSEKDLDEAIAKAIA